jgi:Glycosyltransferase
VTLAAAVGAALARAPLVTEQFGTEPIAGRLGRAAVGAADRTVVPSELVRTAVRERAPDETDTVVIPESIAYPKIEATEPDAGIDIAYAHRLDETANLEALLLALAELRTLGWTATVVGDGPQRAAYEQQAEKLRIDDRVRFVGAPDRERRLAVYRGAHVFVQTAMQVVFPTELLWALAAGCVGIVEYHAESSAHELIENYDRSFRVTDTAAMTAAIEDASKLEHKTVDDRWQAFGHERVLKQYADLYGELTGKERTREPIAR